MEKKKFNWKILLIELIMLHMVVFFPGCSCGKETTSNSADPNLKNQTFTVMFYTGTEETPNITYYNVRYDSLIKEPNEPKRTGYTFVAWCKDITCTSPWTFSIDTVKINLTLYAYWRENTPND